MVIILQHTQILQHQVVHYQYIPFANYTSINQREKEFLEQGLWKCSICLNIAVSSAVFLENRVPQRHTGNSAPERGLGSYLYLMCEGHQKKQPEHSQSSLLGSTARQISS
jgi:hypothetical protein